MIHKDIWDNIGIPMDSESIDMVSDHIESMEKLISDALDALKLARAYVLLVKTSGPKQSADLERIDATILKLESAK